MKFVFTTFHVCWLLGRPERLFWNTRADWPEPEVTRLLELMCVQTHTLFLVVSFYRDRLKSRVVYLQKLNATNFDWNHQILNHGQGYTDISGFWLQCQQIFKVFLSSLNGTKGFAKPDEIQAYMIPPVSSWSHLSQTLCKDVQVQEVFKSDDWTISSFEVSQDFLVTLHTGVATKCLNSSKTGNDHYQIVSY